MGISSRNKLCSILISAMRCVAMLCVTGPIMQAFLASLGFDSQALYIHTTLVQLANVTTIMLCAGWADRGNLIRRSALVQLPHAMLYLGYLRLPLPQYLRCRYRHLPAASHMHRIVRSL